MNLEWFIFPGIAIILNVLVSVYIAKRDDLEKFQKRAQIIIVWMIPYFAAIGIWLFNRSHDDNSHPKGPRGSNPHDSIGATSGADEFTSY